MAGQISTRTKSDNEVLRAARLQAAGGLEEYQRLISEGYDFSQVDDWARKTFGLADAHTATDSAISDPPEEEIGTVLNPGGPVDSVRGTLETPVAGFPLWGWALGGLALWAVASGKV